MRIKILITSILLFFSSVLYAEYNILVLDVSSREAPEYYATVTKESLKQTIYNNKLFALHQEKKARNFARKMGFSHSEADLGKLVNSIEFIDYIVLVIVQEKKGIIKVKVKLFSRKSSRTISFHEENAKTIGSMDSAVEKIVIKMADDIEKDNQEKINKEIFMSIFFNCLIPSPPFSNIVSSPGYGLSFKAGINNIFLQNLNLNLELGYFSFSGKINNADLLVNAPVVFSVGFRIKIFDKFSVNTSVGLGGVYIQSSHGSGVGFNQIENSMEDSFEFLSKAGIEFRLTIWKTFDLIGGCDFLYIVEDRFVGYLNFNIGISNRF